MRQILAAASSMVFALVVVVVMMCGLVGCGSTETRYIEVPSENAAQKGTFEINTTTRTQKATLKLKDGFITGLQELGTMKYKPANVTMVMYVSDRQYHEVAPIVNQEGTELSVSFAGTVNNDDAQIIFLMDDGEQYPIDQRALQLRCNEQVRYSADDWGFTYGHQELTYISVVNNGDGTITFDICFGCDKLIGLMEDVDPRTIGGIAWQLESDGYLYPAMLKTNERGSYYASVTVPLVQIVQTGYYGGPSTTGQLVVYSKSGLRVPFSNWKNGYDWEYYWDYPELEIFHPYWDAPGKEGIMEISTSSF